MLWAAWALKGLVGLGAGAGLTSQGEGRSHIQVGDLEAHTATRRLL